MTDTEEGRKKGKEGEGGYEHQRMTVSQKRDGEEEDR